MVSSFLRRVPQTEDPLHVRVAGEGDPVALGHQDGEALVLSAGSHCPGGPLRR